MERQICLGLDFGTDSVRAVLIDSGNGENIASSISFYKRWKTGKYCDPINYQFRQHPLDHLESLEEVIREVIRSSGINAQEVKSLCIDTTGSSPIPVDRKGVPLALYEGFSDDPDAMMILWKDHKSIVEAEQINHLAKTWGGEDYTKYSGGIYSPEWFWSKILHIARKNEKVKNAAYTWLEHCDLISYMISDVKSINEIKRSRCAAGHKAMWHESWEGYPHRDFLGLLDPYLASVRDTLPKESYTSDKTFGHLSAEWAKKLGLSKEVIISVGLLDAHAGAVGGQIEEGTLVRVMGTSTCDMLISKEEDIRDRCVRGISGQVNGSIIPGMIGLEAGQSAFGDVLDWFKSLLTWPLDHILKNEQFIDEAEQIKSRILEELTMQAESLEVSNSDLVSLDWINGRRTPDVNPLLKGAINGVSIGTNAPLIYKSLVESICFGAKKIVDRFRDEGLEIKSIIGIGGVANKSPYVMQTLADILNMPIRVVASQQTGGLGAAMFAAVAAGIYPSIELAIRNMGQGFKLTYYPKQDHVKIYGKLYHKYCELGDFVESKTESIEH